MGLVITVRDVPADVREALGATARERGQSLQAYLLSVLEQQARFGRNGRLLSQISEDLEANGGGADHGAPDPGEAVRQARSEAPSFAPPGSSASA